MIKITLQRNDHKETSDSVSYTKDTIVINGQEFTFPVGTDINFQSPHDQIIDAKRDSEGILHAIVIKQYIEKEKEIFETCDKDGHYGSCEHNEIATQSVLQTLSAEIKVISEEELIDEELQTIESEIKAMEDNVLKSIIQDRMEGKI